MAYRDFREAVKEKTAISAGEYPDVKDRKDATVRTVSDESTETLFECNDGGRQLEFGKGITTSRTDGLDASADERFTGRIKGKFVDNQTTERLTRDIDALPKRAGSQENGMGILSEFLE